MFVTGECVNGEASTRAYMLRKCCASCAAVGSSLVTPAPSLPGCIDSRVECADWKTAGECTGASAEFLKAACPVSCGACRAAPPPPPSPLCADALAIEACLQFLAQGQCLTQARSGLFAAAVLSFCLRFVCGVGLPALRDRCGCECSAMRSQCARTCSFCTAPTVAPTSACMDANVDCAKWSSAGDCNGPSQNYVSAVCPKSCLLCIATGPDAGNIGPAAASYASAVVNASGVRGSLLLQQIGALTSVSINLSGLAYRGNQYGIYSGSIAANGMDACDTRAIQGVFNPFNTDAIAGAASSAAPASCAEADPSCTALASLGSCDSSPTVRLQCPISCKVCASKASAPCNPLNKSLSCAAGDLSGKHGSLANFDVFAATYADASVRIVPPNSVLGRAFVVKDASGKSLACANIQLAAAPSVAPSPSPLATTPGSASLSPMTCVDVLPNNGCATARSACREPAGSVLGDKARAQCRKTCGLCSVNDCQVGGTVPPFKIRSFTL